MNPVHVVQSTPSEPPEPPRPDVQPVPGDESGQPTDAQGQADQAEQSPNGTVTESAPSSPATPSQGSPSSGFVAVGILIGVCLVGGVLVMMVRRRLLHGEADEFAAGSLMDSLRGMLKRGEITQAEFDAAKRSMVSRLAAKTKGGPTPKAKGRAGDDTGA